MRVVNPEEVAQCAYAVYRPAARESYAVGQAFQIKDYSFPVHLSGRAGGTLEEPPHLALIYL